MTEQEIIQYLKDNKKNGVAYSFMPEKVRKWCNSHIKDLLYFDSFYKQFLFINYNITTHGICEDDIVMDVIALLDNYEIEKEEEKKGEWLEFKIRNGYFEYACDEEHIPDSYLWFDWQKFLCHSYDYDYNFTNFGGWQYRNCPMWFMTPQIEEKGIGYSILDVPLKNYTVTIPDKIRFWRKTK